MRGEPKSFEIAPVSAVFLVLTLVVLLIPISFGVIGSVIPLLHVPMLGTSAFILLLCVATWAFVRPTRFEVGPEDFRIAFPVWARVIPRHEVEGAKIITAAEFKHEFGYALRMGVGGLFGTFAWLKTARGTVEAYITRTDGWVLVRRHGKNPILITPRDPQELVRALQSAGPTA